MPSPLKNKLYQDNRPHLVLVGAPFFYFNHFYYLLQREQNVPNLLPIQLLKLLD